MHLDEWICLDVFKHHVASIYRRSVSQTLVKPLFQVTECAPLKIGQSFAPFIRCYTFGSKFKNSNDPKINMNFKVSA